MSVDDDVPPSATVPAPSQDGARFPLARGQHFYALVVVGLMALAATIAISHAVEFPIYIGYDEKGHRSYADILIHQGRIPSKLESNEFNTPPGFYAISGAAALVSEKLHAGDPWKIARALNVVWTLGAAVLVLLIGRLVFPRERTIHLAALGFVVFVPVVPKAGAMFHPESLSLFTSTLALYAAVRLLARRSFQWRASVALGLALGAAQLVRAFSLWTFAAVIVALLAVGISGYVSTKQAVRTTVIVVAVTALVTAPWYIRQTIVYSNPLVFNQRAPHQPLWDRRPVSFYIDSGFPGVITDPIRPNFANEFIPTLYSDIWGDYFGYFAWLTRHSGHTLIRPTSIVKFQLVAQNLVGLLPTILALGGWLALLGRVRSRRAVQERPSLLLIWLLPLLGMLGFLYFTISYPTEDGDVIKGSYLLTTTPGWALTFGYAVNRLRRNRVHLTVVSLLLGVAGIFDLVFLLHRGVIGPL